MKKFKIFPINCLDADRRREQKFFTFIAFFLFASIWVKVWKIVGELLKECYITGGYREAENLTNSNQIKIRKTENDRKGSNFIFCDMRKEINKKNYLILMDGYSNPINLKKFFLLIEGAKVPEIRKCELQADFTIRCAICSSVQLKFSMSLQFEPKLIYEAMKFRPMNFRLKNSVIFLHFQGKIF